MYYGRYANGESQILILFFLVCGIFESNNLAQTRWAYFTLALGSTDSRNYYFLEFLKSSSACKKCYICWLECKVTQHFPWYLQIGVYAGGGGLSDCTGARGGHGGQQGYPANGPCGGSISGRAGTQSRGGEGGCCLLCYR